MKRTCCRELCPISRLYLPGYGRRECHRNPIRSRLNCNRPTSNRGHEKSLLCCKLHSKRFVGIINLIVCHYLSSEPQHVAFLTFFYVHKEMLHIARRNFQFHIVINQKKVLHSQRSRSVKRDKENFLLEQCCTQVELIT